MAACLAESSLSGLQCGTGGNEGSEAGAAIDARLKVLLVLPLHSALCQHAAVCVPVEHGRRACIEIGHNGENDPLPRNPRQPQRYKAVSLDNMSSISTLA